MTDQELVACNHGGMQTVFLTSNLMRLAQNRRHCGVCMNATALLYVHTCSKHAITVRSTLERDDGDSRRDV